MKLDEMMAPCPFPIAIMSFNRPDLLAEVLKSLKSQTIGFDQKQIHLFQDGAQSRFTQEPADDSLQNECVKCFRDIFPNGQVHQSPVNLGVALNFDRAERLFFEELEAECGLFFEDDLFLSPHYLDALLQLANFALAEPLVAYVAAYGDHKVPLESQRSARAKIMPMAHNWGFALTRRQWLRQREIVDGYLSIVRDKEYALRDVKRIAAYYASFGFAHPASSQDGAKAVAGYVLGTTRLMSSSCFGHYIGKEGTHFTTDFYNMHGFDKTELFDGPPPQFEFPSRSQLATQISDERAFSQRLLGASGLKPVVDAGKISENKYIYFGNLLPNEEQYKSGLFVGLALSKKYDRDIVHDATTKLPFSDNSIIGFQSQDVFEHIEFSKIPAILDEIFRCLRQKGILRLSVPDYNSPLLRNRSIYDFRRKNTL